MREVVDPSSKTKQTTSIPTLRRQVPFNFILQEAVRHPHAEGHLGVVTAQNFLAAIKTPLMAGANIN